MDIEGVYYCSRCVRQIEEEGVCPHCGYDHRREKNHSPALDIGTLLHGRYQLGSVIGSGGAGITYAAWDEVLQIPVAVKEYFPANYAMRQTEYADHIEAPEEYRGNYLAGLNHFVRESRVLAMMKDLPGVVGVQDCFEENETAYIVMEYIHGTTLGQYAKERRLSGKELFMMLVQPIDALIALHKQGVLHRDITPANILVQEDGAVKLIDFGSSADINREQSVIVVTQNYAPIEQYNAKGMGAWTDVYGLCATIYEVLTGIIPPESILRAHKDELIPISKAGVKLKKYQNRAIMGGLAVEPQKRIQSMEEFRSILYHLPMPEAVKQRKQFVRRVSAAAIAVLAVLLVIVLNFAVGLPLGGGLLFSIRGDGIHIVGEYSLKESRILPSHLLGLPVSAIEEAVFKDNALLKEAVIPGSVRTVGSQAFYNCQELVSVTMGEGVEEIGSEAFAKCGKLTEAELPGTLVWLPEDTFRDSSGLLTLWGEKDGELETLAEKTGVPFSSPSDFETEPNEAGVTLTAYHGTDTVVVLPSMIGGQWVTELKNDGEDVLELPEDMTEVTLPDRVTHLGKGILSGRETLEKVVLGSQMEVLGEDAFRESGIRQMNFPEGLRTIGDGALQGTKLAEAELPSTLTSIGKSAFSGCYVEKLDMPDSVTQMGESSFTACVKLEAVSLSSGLSGIPEGTFEGCTRLNKVEIPEGIEDIGMMAFARCRSLEELFLPETVKSIQVYALMECVGLRYLSIPESVDDINTYALDGCSGELVIAGKQGTYAEALAKYFGYGFEDKDRTQEVTIGTSGNAYVLDSDIEELVFPSYDEENESAVTKVLRVNGTHSVRVHLPISCEEISTWAFAENEDLEEVVVPDTLKEVGECAFYNCAKLKTFAFPDDLEIIGDCAFSGCESLADAAFPDAVKYIGRGAFYNCRNIRQITIPTSVSLLPDAAFSGTGITEITIPGNVKKCRAAFWNCKELRTAEVENGICSMWESFAGCENLESVTLPESLEILTQYTFAGCTSLKDVTIYADDFIINEEPMVNKINVYQDGKEVEEIPLKEEYGTMEHLFGSCPDVTIHAHAGSKAEEYAKKYHLDFKQL